jgi:hypothetical protein
MLFAPGAGGKGFSQAGFARQQRESPAVKGVIKHVADFGPQRRGDYAGTFGFYKLVFIFAERGNQAGKIPRVPFLNRGQDQGRFRADNFQGIYPLLRGTFR